MNKAAFLRGVAGAFGAATVEIILGVYFPEIKGSLLLHAGDGLSIAFSGFAAGVWWEIANQEGK